MQFLYKRTSILQCTFILLCTIIHSSNAERRILDGKQLALGRSYVVYMIKANDTILYDTWLCGGALVSPWYILTSAACVEDVKHMYAIAGYSRYVPYENIDQDECTRRMKKKIVYVCLPRDYNFDYPRVEKWANIDIALAKVEQEYNFADNNYVTYCSYRPTIIEINYDEKLQSPDTDAIVFGWGHTEKWRSEEDTRDHNQDNLLYGSVRLSSKEECKRQFENLEFRNIIEKYMICNMFEGNLDEKGEQIQDFDAPLYAQECGPGALRVGNNCVYDRYKKNDKYRNYGYTRRRGICQNDHGGPIITWRGPKEVVIGVSSVFKVDKSTKHCIAPFLYTSTHCNGAFIHCLLSSSEGGEISESEIRRCDSMAKDSGFKIIRRTISWIGHPDGPAYNEINVKTNKMADQPDILKLQRRPQIPIFNRAGA